MTDYGQRPAMEDESMVGTLAAQASMIWPVERPVLERLGLPSASRILDLGCGTGEVAGRIAAAWPEVHVLGVDLYARHVDLARDRLADRPNVTFEVGDAYALPYEAGRFDAVLVRHLVHALPDRASLYAEARRVLRPGGLLWVLAEDYAGLLFDVEDEKARSLFLDGREAMLGKGTELFHGRTVFRELQAAGLDAVEVHPIVVGTTIDNRGHWQAMLTSWRDGYADYFAEGLGIPRDDARARFDALIQATGDRSRYSCWVLYGLSARR